MAEQDKIRLEIVTPEHEVFHAMVERFSVPTLMGSTGILYNHAPLLTVLTAGVISYVSEGESGKIAVSGGFMELRDNEAEILVPTAEKASEIDKARAVAAADRARHRLENRSSGLDEERARAALMRAMARLHALE
jgi:F-type H+-transporting ATPase subunit epsilon